VHVGTGREFVCEKTVDGATVDLPADFKIDVNADVFKIVRGGARVGSLLAP